MKMAISFISGIAVCCLIIFGVRMAIPTRADTAVPAGADNATAGLTNILPNFEKIYHDALTEPFIKAQSKITDPDIADFYQGLMAKTGLTDASPVTN
ncbi:MAG: hypothetical protein ABR886_08990 [Dehalococcoidales bacterium]|jgi:hypothetical protein